MNEAQALPKADTETLTSRPFVSIVIPNYNGQRFLAPCLTAVFALDYPNYEVIVVDNGSQDDSVALVTASFPRTRVITLPVNAGFGAAVNEGIRASVAPFVATLNNDTVVDPMWLTMLMRALIDHPDAGMAASKMLFVDPPNVINSAGICIDRAGIAWDRLGGQNDSENDITDKPVFGACAGAALYRRRMLDEIGLFDADFFAYLEDVDLAWRAQLAGWHAIYVPTARVIHWHSATGIEGSPFKSRLLGRNKIWLILKNYPNPYLWIYLPLIVAYDLAAVMYAILMRHDAAPLQGRIAGLRGVAPFWLKRRTVQSTRRVSVAQHMRRFEPLVSPWHVLGRYAHLR